MHFLLKELEEVVTKLRSNVSYKFKNLTLLKFLSVMIATSEEKLLNLLGRILHSVDDDIIGTEREREFIFNRFLEDMVNEMEISDAICMKEEEVVAYIVERYIESNNEDLLQILNRVLYRYYGYDVENRSTLLNALIKFTQDFFSYCYTKVLGEVYVGKELTRKEYDMIHYKDKRYIVVSKDGMLGLLSKNSKVLFEFEYDSIDIEVDNYII